MARISDGLIDPGDGPERNVEKLLIIADALIRQVEIPRPSRVRLAEGRTRGKATGMIKTP